MEAALSYLPVGTVTFLFTDIEGSTQLWEQAPEEMMGALVGHDEIFERVVADNGGVVVRPRGEGDSRFAVFEQAWDAVAAAVIIQKQFYVENWPTPRPLKVRMALHTGKADLRMGDYYGSAVNRCARLRSIAHGGQTVLSMATRELVHNSLPADVLLQDEGEHRLKDLTRPEHVFQLLIIDLPQEFPSIEIADGHTQQPADPVDGVHWKGRSPSGDLAFTRTDAITDLSRSGWNREESPGHRNCG